MRPIPPVLKPIKEEEPKFISICNQGESLVELKKTKQGFALLIKEEITPPAEIHEKIKSFLGKFKEVVHDELLKCNTLPHRVQKCYCNIYTSSIIPVHIHF